MPETIKITKDFTYDIPDSYLAQTNTQGKTATWTYQGPSRMWIHADTATGKIMPTPVYLDEHEGELIGDPGPHLKKILVDANVDTLLAALIHDETDIHHPDFPKTQETLPDGHVHIMHDPQSPSHTYETSEITYDFTNNKWNTPFPWRKPHQTMADVMHARNSRLKHSDNIMHQLIAQGKDTSEWVEYRQKLRDYPALMQGVDPWKWKFPDAPDDHVVNKVAEEHVDPAFIAPAAPIPPVPVQPNNGAPQ